MDKQCKFIDCKKSSCSENNGRRGWCGTHYRRWQRHGDPSICKYATDGSGCIFEGYKILTINGEQIYEHRYIMEKYLGKKLNPKEIIHHINENTLDNRIENLEISSQANHCSHHMKKRFAYLQKTNNIKCETCGKIVFKKTWEIKAKKHHFCSFPCSAVARRIGGINHIKKYSIK